MSDNSCEYIIKQKSEGKVLYKKASAIFGCVILGAVASSLSMQAPRENLRLTLLLISITVAAFLAFISLKMLSVEYEITIEYKELSVTTIYGRVHRRLTVAIPLSSISEMGEYNDEAYEELCKVPLQKDYIAMSSLAAPTVYYAIFDDEKHNCILYFDVTEKAAEILKKQIPSAFRASARRINNAQAQQ